jgi:hypothetical protein
MTDFLASLKADLVGRRLLPLVAVVVVALVGGVAYAVLGGSGSSSSSAPTASLAGSLPPAPPTLASPAPTNPNVAASETTTGLHYQRGGPSHNPFKRLPEPKPVVAKTSTSAASTPAPTKTSSAPSGGGTTPTGPSNPTPTTPKKKVVQRSFQVALLFGLAPPAGQNPQLVPYENLTRLTPLPDKEHALLVYSGVTSSGQAAVFTLLHEAIVKGAGTCLPSETQCEMIKLPVGKTEELQYLGNEGQAVTYLLQVVSIVKHEVTSTPFAAKFAAKVSRAGRKLLREAGLAATEDLRYLPGQDVVVFAQHHPH